MRSVRHPARSLEASLWLDRYSMGITRADGVLCRRIMTMSAAASSRSACGECRTGCRTIQLNGRGAPDDFGSGGYTETGTAASGRRARVAHAWRRSGPSLRRGGRAFFRQYRDPMQLVLLAAGIGSLYLLKQRRSPAKAIRPASAPPGRSHYRRTPGGYLTWPGTCHAADGGGPKVTAMKARSDRPASDDSSARALLLRARPAFELARLPG
jgi:hypothetical protein